MNYCQNCGNQLKETDKFCSNCGSDINNNEYCNNCGLKLNQDSNFCSNCGNSRTSNASVVTNELTKSNVVYVLLLLSIIGSGIACFLPIFKFWIFSINFVYNDGQVADGVFIVVIQVIALIALLCKNRVFVMILQVLASSIFIYDFSRMFSLLKGNDYITTSVITSFLGTGFYILVVSLILALILSIVRVVSKDKYI